MIQDKLNHLALSVPDVSPGTILQPSQTPSSSGPDWMSNSLPAARTIISVPPTTASTSSKKTTTFSNLANVYGANGPASTVVAINQGSVTTTTTTTNDQSLSMLDGHARPNINGGWFNGLLGCLRPVWTIIGKATSNDLKNQQSGKQHCKIQKSHQQLDLI